MTGVTSKNRILVIKLGALGDFIQALGPMAAIHAHHPDAHITLLTTKPFVTLGRDCNYFDEIWIDERPKIFNITGWMTMKKKLNAAKFTRVYDLQNNNRTTLYFSLFKFSQQPEWVGATPGASHRNDSPARTAGHAFDGHVQTLALAGIRNVKIDTLSWMEGNLSPFALAKPYVVLVPGCAPEHPQKRWPAAQYGRLASMIASWGYQPVILGTKAEAQIAAQITAACPKALDLTGQTTLAQVVALGRSASAAIGNDTGPLHMIAATGCPVTALFSGFSNRVRHAPQGESVQIVQQEDLNDLKPEDVLKNFKPRGEPPKKPATLH